MTRRAGARQTRRPLLFLAAYALLILGSAPWGLGVWDSLAPLLGSWPKTSLALLALASSVALGWWVVAAARGRRRARGLALLGIAALACVAVDRLILGSGTPAERLHIPEYALLGALAMRALAAERRHWQAAIVAVAIVALLDEAIQGMLPSRYFDLRDIAANLGGGLIGCLVWSALPDRERAREAGG